MPPLLTVLTFTYLAPIVHTKCIPIGEKPTTSHGFLGCGLHIQLLDFSELSLEWNRYRFSQSLLLLRLLALSGRRRMLLHMPCLLAVSRTIF
ncbi:hypothetical protein GGX14DRAFT_475273 [Mycena pura]|uniref:Secreted protein n=1 Tax=Mycena pura TaxID=153505 RepID=A0AAD6Y7U5_9AGAR|nr:hypothetical protein GGX14DRAFT_475273 [Mycena pura]